MGPIHNPSYRGAKFEEDLRKGVFRRVAGAPVVSVRHKGPKRGYYPCEIDHQNECHFLIVESIEFRYWGLVFQKTYGLLRN